MAGHEGLDRVRRDGVDLVDWHAEMVNRLRAAYPDVRLWTSFKAYSGVLEVSALVVPSEQRGSGVGTRVMRELIAEADRRGVPIALTPDAAFGGSKARLARWYKGLGFRPNAGRARNFMTRETLIRQPAP